MYTFELSDHTKVYKRQVQGTLEIFGNVGGVSSVVLLIFGSLFGRFSEFNFKENAIKTLYQVKTAYGNPFAGKRA
jgi:hypothetical protein